MEMNPYVLHVINGISPLQVSLDCFRTICESNYNSGVYL